jgi:hypothetical protein
MLGVILVASLLCGFATRENWPGFSHRPAIFVCVQRPADARHQ